MNDDKKEETSWKKNDVPKNKTRYYYRSVDDVIEKGKRPGGFKASGASRYVQNVSYDFDLLTIISRLILAN